MTSCLLCSAKLCDTLGLVLPTVASPVCGEQQVAAEVVARAAGCFLLDELQGWGFGFVNDLE